MLMYGATGLAGINVIPEVFILTVVIDRSELVYEPRRPFI